MKKIKLSGWLTKMRLDTVRKTLEKTTTDITLRISGGGGNTEGSVNLIKEIGAIRQIFGGRRKVTGIGIGDVGSSLAYILIACDHRQISRDGLMLIHPVQISISVYAVSGGQIPRHIVGEAWGYQRFLEGLLTERTKLNQKDLDEISHGQAIFSAQQALEAGLVDEIV